MGNNPFNGIDGDGGWFFKFMASWQRDKAIAAGLEVSELSKGGNGWGFTIFQTVNDHESSVLKSTVGTFVSSDNWKNYTSSQVSQYTPNFWGRQSEGNILQSMFYDTANGFYTTSQIFMFRSVGTNSIRNLDRSATTSEQGVLGFGQTYMSLFGALSSSLIKAHPVVNMADDAFVHVTTPGGATNILSKGLNPEISGFVTKWKYVKNVTNASDFNTMLYSQKLWPQMAGKFDNGFNILQINAKPTFFSPRTNWVNGIPQYKFNTLVPPSNITLIK
jgi:hypothetical protein